MAKVKGTKEFPVVLVANQSTYLSRPAQSHSRVLCALCVSRPRSPPSQSIELFAAEGEEAGWEITSKEGRSIAYTYRCPFVEASAKTGLGVDSIFSNIVKEIKGRRLSPSFLCCACRVSCRVPRVVCCVVVSYCARVSFYGYENATR
jgi:hypothetical protein